MLEVRDYENLLSVLRLSAPTTFAEGKELVVLESKLILMIDSLRLVEAKELVDGNS